MVLKHKPKKEQDVTVVKALTRDQYDLTALFQLLYELNNSQGVVHPSHLIWCTASTTDRDLGSFVVRYLLNLYQLSQWINLLFQLQQTRAKHFRDLPESFYIIGINYLPTSVRRKLLRIIADLHANVDRPTLPL